MAATININTVLGTVTTLVICIMAFILLPLYISLSLVLLSFCFAVYAIYQSGVTVEGCISFCTVNGFNFSYQTKVLHDGVFSEILNKYPLTSVISANIDDSTIVLGNLISQESTGNGASSKRIKRTVATISLGAQLPNILLTYARMPYLNQLNFPPFSEDSVSLPLEGDFINYFSLTTMKGRERDALYILTPNVMEDFIGYAHGYDIEMVDSRLIIYKIGTYSNDEIKTFFDLLLRLKSSMQKNISAYNPGNEVSDMRLINQTLPVGFFDPITKNIGATIIIILAIIIAIGAMIYTFNTA